MLQEYAYDDFRKLAEYLGGDLVDTNLQRFSIDALEPEALVAALAAEYAPGQAEVAEVD